MMLTNPLAAALLSADMVFSRDDCAIDSLGLEWECEEGFVANVKKVCAEYVEAFNLRPLRILLVGPPAAGKSHFARQLAAKYHLPHITTGDCIREVMAADELRLRAEASDAMAAAKDKRIPAPVLSRIIRRKLLTPPCRNWGFVLDGFPRNATEATAVFSKGEPRAPLTRTRTRTCAHVSACSWRQGSESRRWCRRGRRRRGRRRR